MSAILVAVDGPQAGEWVDALRPHAGGRALRVWPDQIGDPADIAYACVWNPPHGLLAGFPNLKAIVNLGATRGDRYGVITVDAPLGTVLPAVAARVAGPR